MSEEQEGGTSIKSILIGLVSTITIAVGGFITNKLTGGEEEAKTEVAAPAPVINITNSNQQAQQAAGGGKTVVIKEKEVAAKPAPGKKKDGDEFKEKEPQW